MVIIKAESVIIIKLQHKLDMTHKHTGVVVKVWCEDVVDVCASRSTDVCHYTTWEEAYIYKKWCHPELLVCCTPLGFL